MSDKATAWREKLGFITPISVTSVFNGKEHKFYAVSVSLIFELKCIAEPLAKALTEFFTKHDRDTTIVTSDSQKQEGENSVKSTETVSQAIDPKLAEFRTNQRMSIVEDLVKKLLDPATGELFGKLVIDALRDDFADSAPPPSILIKEMQAPQIWEVLVGMAKANKGVFGPLALSLEGMFGGKVKAAMDKAKLSIPGSSSPTESLGSSNEGMTQTG